MGDSHVGLQARMMSQAMRKLAGTLNRTDTICIFTNQLREKIGVMFGNPEMTPGGRALKFYSSVRLDIRRIETLKEGVEAIGNRVRVKVAKNKVAPPFKQAEFDIIYGQGISWEGTVLDSGLERKVVQKSGSYFSFEDERLGQGRLNAAAFLREHPDVTAGDPPADPGAARRRPDRLRAAAPDRRRRRQARSPPRRRRRSRGSRGGVPEEVEVEAASRSRSRDGRLEAASAESVSAKALDRPSARLRGVTTPPRPCARSSTGPGSPRTRGTTRVETLERAATSTTRGSPRDARRAPGRAGLRRRVDPRRPRGAGGRPRDGRAARSRRSSRSASGRRGGGAARRRRAGGADTGPRGGSPRRPGGRCGALQTTRRRSRIEALHLTFCLHTTYFRIELDTRSH